MKLYFFISVFAFYFLIRLVNYYKSEHYYSLNAIFIFSFYYHQINP